MKPICKSSAKMNTKKTMTFQEWLESTCNSSNPLSDRDTMLLWKGLTMLMCKTDRPSMQAEVAEQLASLIHCFNKKDAAIRFYYAFLKIMIEEWCNIDKLHVHKWVMLISRVTRQCFVVLDSKEWDEENVKELSKNVDDIICDRGTPYEFLKHFTEIFLGELGKLAAGKVSNIKVKWLILPFTAITTDRDCKYIGHTKKQMIEVILHQSDFQNLSTITNLEVQPKKMKLSKAERLKLRKREFLYSWIVTDLRTDEISFTDNTDYNKENVISGSWDPPLREEEAREAEIFISRRQHRKNQVNAANASWCRFDDYQSPSSASASTSTNTSCKKHVKIMLEYNCSQEATEYFEQLIRSPKVAYDRTKKPSKGLLKPNSVINHKHNNIRL